MAGQACAAAYNQVGAAAAPPGGAGPSGGEAGPSNRADPGAGARWDGEQAEKRKQEAAAAEEEVEVEVLSQQLSEVLSPPKPPRSQGLEEMEDLLHRQ